MVIEFSKFSSIIIVSNSSDNIREGFAERHLITGEETGETIQ